MTGAARAVPRGEGVRAHFELVAATALDEDLGGGGAEADVTTQSVVTPSLWGRAVVIAKQAGVLCGVAALEATFGRLEGRVAVTPPRADGDHVEELDVIAHVEGPVRPILVGERAALNVLGHLSGIATMVRSFVEAAPHVEVADTRKTLPGLRALEKYAVRTGGGSNHRFALWDGVLIKDNHIVAAGGVAEAVRRARAATTMPVQAECTSGAEVDEAIDAGAAALLLDNQSPASLRDLVSRVRERDAGVLIEASGGITSSNVAEVAASGVDRISVGAFTHSALAVDVSLQLTEVWEEGG